MSPSLYFPPSVLLGRVAQYQATSERTEPHSANHGDEEEVPDLFQVSPHVSPPEVLVYGVDDREVAVDEPDEAEAPGPRYQTTSQLTPTTFLLGRTPNSQCFQAPQPTLESARQTTQIRVHRMLPPEVAAAGIEQLSPPQGEHESNALAHGLLLAGELVYVPEGRMAVVHVEQVNKIDFHCAS